MPILWPLKVPERGNGKVTWNPEYAPWVHSTAVQGVKTALGFVSN